MQMIRGENGGGARGGAWCLACAGALALVACGGESAAPTGHRWPATPSGAFDLPQCAPGQTLTGQVDATFGLNLRASPRQPPSWEQSNIVYVSPVPYGQIVLVDQVRVGETYATQDVFAPWSDQWAYVRVHIGGTWRYGFLAGHWIAPLGCLSPVPTAGPTQPPPPGVPSLPPANPPQPPATPGTPPATPGWPTPSVNGWEQLPAAELFSGNPSGFADGAGQSFLFYRSTDGAVYERRRADGQAWSSASLPVEGATRSAPAALLDAQGRHHVFARGTDDRIYERVRTAGVWAAWQVVDAYMATHEPPAVALDGQGQLFLFLRSTANQLLENHWQGTSWRGWTLVPSLPTDRALAVARRPDGRLELYARGTDGRIYRTTRQDTRVYGGGYDGWQALPDATESLLSSAAVAPGADGELRIYAIGSRRTLFELAPAARSWTVLPSPGVEVPEGPSAFFDGRMIRLFVRDLQGRCYTLAR